MMHRSRRNNNDRGDDDDDNASVATTNTGMSSTGSSIATTNNSTKSKKQQKRWPARGGGRGGGGGSFASATASSLARGGPGTEAPPARSASEGTGVVGPAASTKRSFSDDDANGDKENEKKNHNASNDRENGDEASGTPAKKNPSSEEEVEGASAVLLSPIPYWKVCQERGNKTSPRTTRSAAKKAQRDSRAALARGMRELDELEAESDSNSSSDDDDDHDDDENLDPTALHFSPLDRKFNESAAANARRRREAESERERARRRKVRKAGSVAIAGRQSNTTTGRATKRPKRGSPRKQAPERQQQLLETSATAAAVAGPSAEQMRRMMQQTIAEHDATRIEELVAKAAKAEGDAQRRKTQLEELEEKCRLLEEERAAEKARGNGDEESALRAKCAEQRGAMDGYIKDILQLECENKAMEERQKEDREAFDRERRDEAKRAEEELWRIKEEHAAELRKAADDAASAKEDRDRTREEHDAAQGELESIKIKLAELIKLNEEIDTLRANGDESREELLGRIAELQSSESELRTHLAASDAKNESNRDTIASLQSDLADHLTTITSNEGAISQLTSKLQATEDDLDKANRRMEGMHSPRSRNALERGFTEEVGGLESRLSAAEGERAELRDRLREKDEENRAIGTDLDEAKVQIGELQSQLGESDGFLKEVTRTADTLKSENADLSEQVQAANVKYDENERQLEEMAAENEQLFEKLEATERESQQRIWDLGSEAQRKEARLETERAATATEKEASDAELRLARSDISKLEARARELEEELAESRRMMSDLQTEKRASDRKLTELSGQLRTLTNHLESAQSTITDLESKLRAKDEYVEQFSSVERRLVQEKNVLQEIRRDLHNRVIQLSGNIRVFVRVRPSVGNECREMMTATARKDPPSGNDRRATMTAGGRPFSASGRPSSRGSLAPSPGRPSSRGSVVPSAAQRSQRSEDGAAECPFHFPSITDRNTTRPATASSRVNSSPPSPNYTSFNDLTKQTIELTEPYKDRGGLNPRRKKWKYGFDRVFHQDSGQDDVWGGAEPLVQSCVDGFHVCMFAYGQTGSGKTHTMIGNSENRGLIPRAVEKLFDAKQEIEMSRIGEVYVNIRVELLEIYNEEVRDLLDDNAGPQGQLLNLKLNSNEAVGNVKVNARDEKEVAGILQLAQERRCVKATKSNAESSRSHLLFTIHFDVTSSCDDGAAIRCGCLHIIDLAGSERVDKSGSHGALLTEAKHINKSLSALALVIEKLQAKKSASEHIPYRDSKLTYLLRNSLGGDSKTLAIVCCSPHQAHFNESLNSIRFAAKASKVELKDTNTFDY